MVLMSKAGMARAVLGAMPHDAARSAGGIVSVRRAASIGRGGCSACGTWILKRAGGWRRERDSNPRDGFPPTHFPGVRLRPLGHLSGGATETTPPSPVQALAPGPRAVSCPRLTAERMEDMQHRRTLLKLGTAGLFAWLWPWAAAGAAGTMAGAALPRPLPAGGGMYLVNGWLLSEADLQRLGLDDP
jgi:hypothetical protein